MAGKAIDAAFSLSVGRGDTTFELQVQLSLDEGILVLFGPSGSGKSLTLQALVGVVRPDRGYVRIHGEKVFGDGVWIAAHQRRVGYVPQHHALFPFCSVMDNIVFGLPREQRRVPPKRIEKLVEELNLQELRNARPTSLSGGEQQRVALARALAVQPRLLVLDEPFASIDVEGRAQLRGVVQNTLARHGTPAVFITHDPIEALQLADRVICLERGRTTASGDPAELLADACEVLRASLMGSG